MKQKDKIRKALDEVRVSVAKPEDLDDVMGNIPSNKEDDVTISVRDTEITENAADDMYVEYLSDRSGEEPFMLGGKKYQYVNAKYPDGKKDIGVYVYGQDLVLNYKWFRKNIIGDDLYEVNSEVMSSMEKTYGSEEAAKKVYYATAKDQGRDPETFEMKENGDYGDVDLSQDDYERASREVEYGISPEAGSYDTLDLPQDELMENINPRMTKGELQEMVTGKKEPKVLKTIKVKDIK